MVDVPCWLIRRERAILIGGAATVAGLAWFYLIRAASEMNSPNHVGRTALLHYPMEFATTFLIWTVMMIAMMLPSSLPFVMAFGDEQRKRRARDLPYISAGVFLAGYFAMWTGFSVFAALLQLALHHRMLLSPRMAATSAAFAGGILIAAGVYQWTPFKDRCLQHCRSPLSFLLSNWREGSFGAFRMGVDQGIFCLGCCWLLMALPLVAGVMNLICMAAITAFILIEKAAPGGQWFGRVGGAALAGAGVWMIAFG